MQIRRTATIIIEPDSDLLATLDTSQHVKQVLSPIAFNDGKPLGAIALQRKAYTIVKGTLNSQMTISAIRQVSAAYASAKRNKHKVTKPFAFKRKSALFLVGKRGRDADFRSDGTLSIWTVGGRKKLRYTVPEVFQELFRRAKTIDSLNVIERGGKLIGRVAMTIDVPDPQGILPVGVDLNETNALVAITTDDQVLFVSGRAVKIRNQRTRKTRGRVQRKLATRKAEKRDTRSVRRLLKRLGRKQSNRTRTFAQETAKQLVRWAPKRSVLVFEDLDIPQPQKGKIRGAHCRRRLSQWPRGLILQWVRNKAEEVGIVVATVDPRYTSQNCSRCGLRGKRARHRFSCPSCGFEDHSDINAARNIRNRYTVSRDGGPLSTGPEARASAAGKPPALAVG
ncbi:MAG: hypothetical protein C4334_05800 [Pyrinomonas sp.]|uniref:RNA-guided endonuclease InsQ/TnpB family protein n=1 Tax=Pyrinomonas sp. TaxID=2080306 RepID=UPI003325A2D6